MVSSFSPAGNDERRLVPGRHGRSKRVAGRRRHHDPFARGRQTVGVRTLTVEGDGLGAPSVPVEIWYPAAATERGRDLEPATCDNFVVAPPLPTRSPVIASRPIDESARTRPRQASALIDAALSAGLRRERQPRQLKP